MEWMTSAEGWASLLTLTVLEVVLGIDNIIFIAILAESCRPRSAIARGGPDSSREFIRIALLMSIVWVMSLTPVPDHLRIRSLGPVADSRRRAACS